MSGQPDERVQTAIDKWGPRMIANGIDFNDFVRTTSSITRWDQWLDAWYETAEVHRALAQEALETGRHETAGEAFLRAAVSFHFSKFVWVLDPALNRAATRCAVESMYAAHAIVDPTARRIEASLDSGPVAANLRRPAGIDRPPLVVLIPGLDSTKEEFFLLESLFLQRGMATLSLDGPGQGESSFTSHIRADYDVAVTAILDVLVGVDGLDLERVGAVGISLGGYYVARAAALEPRLRAVAGVSGPYDFGACWEVTPSLTREAFAHYSGAADEADARRRAGTLTLAGVAERIEQPCLMVTGKLDRIIPWELTKQIADEAPRGEFVLYDDGSHVCNNIPFKYRPLMADWIRDRLGEI
jgi:2,6-dihydroxypseudooxynicotine hydrolase